MQATQGDTWEEEEEKVGRGRREAGERGGCAQSLSSRAKTLSTFLFARGAGHEAQW